MAVARNKIMLPMINTSVSVLHRVNNGRQTRKTELLIINIKVSGRNARIAVLFSIAGVILLEYAAKVMRKPTSPEVGKSESRKEASGLLNILPDFRTFLTSGLTYNNI